MVAMTKIEAVEVVARRWSVVLVRPHSERLAKDNLERQGFEVYLPMAVSTSPATAKTPARVSVRPFFPGYLFVRVDPLVDAWRKIFSTIGVKTLLLAGERPLAVRDALIEGIRQREEAGLIKMIDPSSVECRFKRGDKVKYRTEAGDLDAVFVEPVDNGRVTILLSILRREVPKNVTLLALS
jgi:transcriptional antiterminator RfaH